MSEPNAGIGVKAMIVAFNESRTAHAVCRMQPTVENPDGFHRLVGGSVETGERHRDAIVREVREELNAAIDDLSLLGVLENIFTCNGRTGHEIAFVYAGRLDPEPALEGAVVAEADGSLFPIEWRPVVDDAVAIPLFPDGVGELVLAAAAR